jgi:hypothetical protein
LRDARRVEIARIVSPRYAYTTTRTDPVLPFPTATKRCFASSVRILDVHSERIMKHGLRVGQRDAVFPEVLR